METIENLSKLTLIDLDEEVIRLAFDLMPEYASKGLGGRDCVIMATMKGSGS